MSKNKKDSLGDRMKTNYEDRSRFYLTRRTPVIIRLDGRAFHTLTKKCQKPFDNAFSGTMECTALELCAGIQNCKCAYIQSDEISLLLTDFDELNTEAWFDYNLQKIVSVSAGMASAYFTAHYCDDGKIAMFDSRAFNIPKEEVANYFIWRQKDWIRNSVSMLAQANFSNKELFKKSQSDMHEMLHRKGINWADLEDKWKNGTFICREASDGSWQIHRKIIFTENRKAIEKYLEKDVVL